MILSEFLYTSPVGTLSIKSKDGYIISVMFASRKSVSKKNNVLPSEILTCCKALDTYFLKHSDRDFKKVDFLIAGTTLQHAVWKLLLTLPFGSAISYSELAKKVGYPKAVRAVASAVAKNPLYLIIPCHRVIPKNGGIGNYGGGVNKKMWLLKHEGTF